MENKETLAFVSEVGVYGSISQIKDQSVKEVNQWKDLAANTKDPALKKYLNEQLNK